MQHVWETVEMNTGFWWGDLMDGQHFKVIGADGRIIIKWIFKKWDGQAWTGLTWCRTGTGTYECGNKLLGSIKCGDSALWSWLSVHDTVQRSIVATV